MFRNGWFSAQYSSYRNNLTLLEFNKVFIMSGFVDTFTTQVDEQFKWGGGGFFFAQTFFLQTYMYVVWMLCHAFESEFRQS